MKNNEGLPEEELVTETSEQEVLPDGTGEEQEGFMAKHARKVAAAVALAGVVGVAQMNSESTDAPPKTDSFSEAFAGAKPSVWNTITEKMGANPDAKPGVWNTIKNEMQFGDPNELMARESVPLDAFYAADEYIAKYPGAVHGEVTEGADVDLNAIAKAHNVDPIFMLQALRHKMNDAKGK